MSSLCSPFYARTHTHTPQLCYDVRSVPDAVNESKQIFKVIIVFIIAAGAIFGIIVGVRHDHFVEVGALTLCVSNSNPRVLLLATCEGCVFVSMKSNTVTSFSIVFS